jgi:predicted membrane channel-forming protein YqfA (hemolysin III family)
VLKSSFVHMFWSLGCSGFYFQWVKRQHLTILITTLSVVLNCCLVLLSFIGIGG